MGATAAWNLWMGVNRLAEVLACEALVACEALEHTTLLSSPMVESFRKMIRNVSPPFESDRTTSAELMTIADHLKSGGWLARLEAEHERLPR